LGRAGIGKSILCQYLATQWASDTASFDTGDGVDAKDEELQEISISHYLQQKFDAVFWLKLREVAAKTADHDMLVDVIDRFCLEGLKKDKPTKAELSSYIDEHTNKILFILDGYDEITDRIDQPAYRHLNRILADIANHQHILLTSRPITIDTLGDHPIQFNRRLENMGFLNENIEAYVYQFMHTAQKPGEAERMLDFLKAHPSVWGIAHIPINLELLCRLWSKGELIFAKNEIVTLSKLYQIVVERIQEKYIEKACKEPDILPLNEPIEIKEESATIADCANIFLERLAYDAMETEPLFIPAIHIKVALEKTLIQYRQPLNTAYKTKLLRAATDKFGFLRTTAQGGKSQLDQEHYFIHLSFQEFYAAKYIARILSQYPHSEEGDQVFQRILTEKYTPHYQLMLWMSAGLLYQQGKKTKQFSPLLRFWRAILSQPRDMIGFHHNVLIMHCLDECEADDRIALHKTLIAQQWREFEFYAKHARGNLYIEQFAYCSILLNSSPIVAYLLQASANSDSGYELTKAAIKALGHLKNPSEVIIKALLSLLQDKNTIARDLAAKALGKLSNSSETVSKVLLTALQDKDRDVRRAAAFALGSLNNPNEAVIIALLSALHDKDRDVRRNVAEALGQINTPSAAVVQALLSTLRDGEEYVRSAAAFALGSLNHLSTAVVEALLTALRDRNAYVRNVAARALGKVNSLNEAVIRELLITLLDKDWEIRDAAANALGNLNNPSETVIEALLSALHDENNHVRGTAAAALGQLNNPGEAVIDALLSALRDRDSYVRSTAARALGNLHDPSSVVIEALGSALQDTHGHVINNAAKALTKINNPSAIVIEMLLSVLRGKRCPYARSDAALALGKLNNPSEAVIETLFSALEDENDGVKIAATSALVKLNKESEAVIRRLLSALRNGKGGWVGHAAAQVLSTPKTIYVTAYIFKQLVRDDQGSFKYFSCWFEENYLLFIDHGKRNVIARQGRQNYSIPLPPYDLTRLEKQMIAVAEGKDYPSEFYNLSGGRSSYAKKAILQSCEFGSSICFISDTMWLAYIVRKKIGQRALLIVEGMVAEKHFMQCYEFTLSQRGSNPSSGFFLPGGGIGRVVKTRNCLDLLEKDKKNYQCKSWDIEPAIGQRLVQSLEVEVSSSEMQRNDCLTWAQAKLEEIGLVVEEGRWTSFTIALPTVVPEKPKKPTSAPVVEENRFCRLM
jgi:HEAT repeat protein